MPSQCNPKRSDLAHFLGVADDRGAGTKRRRSAGFGKFGQKLQQSRRNYLAGIETKAKRRAYLSHFESLKKYGIWYASCHGVRAVPKVFPVERHIGTLENRHLRFPESHGLSETSSAISGKEPTVTNCKSKRKTESKASPNAILGEQTEGS